MTWKKVEDENVRHLWRCNDPCEEGCDEEVEVTPDWYENNGTPVCSNCDCDMNYLRTEVKS